MKENHFLCELTTNLASLLAIVKNNLKSMEELDEFSITSIYNVEQGFIKLNLSYLSFTQAKTNPFKLIFRVFFLSFFQMWFISLLIDSFKPRTDVWKLLKPFLRSYPNFLKPKV